MDIKLVKVTSSNSVEVLVCGTISRQVKKIYNYNLNEDSLYDAKRDCEVTKFKKKRVLSSINQFCKIMHGVPLSQYIKNEVNRQAACDYSSLFDEEYIDNASIIKADLLPEGWEWHCYDDGSGGLCGPNGKTVFSYDLQTQEYKDYNGEWHFMERYPEHTPAGLFFEFAERAVKKHFCENQ